MKRKLEEQRKTFKEKESNIDPIDETFTLTDISKLEDVGVQTGEVYKGFFPPILDMKKKNGK